LGSRDDSRSRSRDGDGLMEREIDRQIDYQRRKLKEGADLAMNNESETTIKQDKLKRHAIDALRKTL